MFSGRLGVIYDSQATNRSVAGSRRVSQGVFLVSYWLPEKKMVLTTRRIQKDPVDVVEVPSAILVSKGAQMDSRGTVAVPLVDLATKGAQVDQGEAAEVPSVILAARGYKSIVEMLEQCPW